MLGRRLPRGLGPLLVAAALGGIAWAWLTPPLQGPDEDSHVAYVQRLVETRELPQDVEQGRFGLSTELLIAQRWAGLLGPPSRPLQKPNFSAAERAAWEADARRLPGSTKADGRGYTIATANPPLHYVWVAVPYAVTREASLWTRLQVMRLWQVLLVLAVVGLTWLLVAELLPDPYWARVLGAGVVAAHPLLTFMAGVVNPDVSLAVVWSAFMLCAVRFARGPTVRGALVLGGLAAASALVHPRGIGIGLAVVLCVAVAALRHRLGLRAVAALGAAALAPAVLGFVAYYSVITVGGDATSGQFQGIARGGGFDPIEFAAYLWQFYLPFGAPVADVPGNLPGFRYVYVDSLFGVFGSLDVFLPRRISTLLWALALVALCGLAAFVVARRAALRRRWAELAVLVAGAVAYMATLHFAAYRTLVRNEFTDAVLVGRYLLPLLALFGLAVAFVATSLPRAWGVRLGSGVLGGMAALHVAALGAGLLRWYA